MWTRTLHCLTLGVSESIENHNLCYNCKQILVFWCYWTCGRRFEVSFCLVLQGQHFLYCVTLNMMSLQTKETLAAKHTTSRHVKQASSAIPLWESKISQLTTCYKNITRHKTLLECHNTKSFVTVNSAVCACLESGYRSRRNDYVRSWKIQGSSPGRNIGKNQAILFLYFKKCFSFLPSINRDVFTMYNNCYTFRPFL